MKRVAVLVLLLSCTTAHAQLADQLQRCKALADDAARLACYDALGSSPAVFGSDHLPAPAASVETTTLQARALDDIKGWKAGTVFRLDNGQSWKVISDDEVYIRPLQQPAVTIRKNLISYWISFEGTHRQARVKRVQ